MSSFNVGSSPEINRPHPLPTPESVRPTTPTPTATESTSPSAHAFVKTAPGKPELPTIQTVHREIDDSSSEAIMEMQNALSAEDLIPEALSEQLEPYERTPLPAPPAAPNPWLADIEQAARARADKAAPERFDHLVARDLKRLYESENQVAADRNNDERLLQETVLPEQHTPAVADFHAGSLLSAPARRPIAIKNFITLRFADHEKELRQSLLSRRKQREILDKAEKQALHLARTARPESDLLFKIATLPAAELRNEVARAISGMRPEKYGEGVNYQDLSERKQALVDTLIKGLKQGLREQSYAVHTAIADRLSAEMNRQLEQAGPRSDLAFNAGLKFKTDLINELALKMGLVSKPVLDDLMIHATASTENTDEFLLRWTKNISPEQFNLLETAATRIQATIHNQAIDTASKQMVSLEEVNREVPAEVTVGGQTFSQPRVLAIGGLGLVLHYQNSETGEAVVVKKQLHQHERYGMVNELQANRHVMGGAEGVGHPNVMGFRGVVRDHNEDLYMVMNLADGGDLSGMTGGLNYATNSGIISSHVQTILYQSFLADAVAGMLHMQNRNMMHLDVKALNFLLDSDGRVMLSDFGSASRGETFIKDTHYIDSTFKAPEWKKGVTPKADIYQFGRVLSLMLGEEIELDIASKSAPRVKPRGNHGSAADFINLMLDDNPAKRPTLEALANGSFLQDIKNQDPAKLLALRQAAVAYGKAVGKKASALTREITYERLRLSWIEAKIKKNEHIEDPEKKARNAAEEINRLHVKLAEIAALEAKLKALNSQPDVIPLVTALRNAAQGFV